MISKQDEAALLAAFSFGTAAYQFHERLLWLLRLVQARSFRRLSLSASKRQVLPR